METAISRFLTYLVRDRGRAPNTVLAYRADLQQMKQVLEKRAGGPFMIEDIDSQALEGYVSWLSAQGYRPATVSRKMAAVRTFLEYLRLVEGQGSPYLLAELRPPPTPKTRPRVLSREEVAALMEAPQKMRTPRGMRDAAILALLYASGMRAAETVSLNLEDVDLEQGQVTKPGRVSYKLPLGVAQNPMERYLRDGRPHLMRRPEEQALFLNQRGQRLSRQGLWLVVKRWTSALSLGDDISPHTLRHTLANHLLKDGKSRKEVQRILGLSSPNTIRIHLEHYA
ncbi:MAG: tyrosine-type recombinase/integrase [Anaerolineales bacterium]